MAKKRVAVKEKNLNELFLTAASEEEKPLVEARSLMRPALNASFVLRKVDDTYDNVPLQAMVDSLTELSEQINRKDLSRAGEMLTAQAHVLDKIFTNMAVRAAVNAGQYLEATETYLRLALRAQSQARSTWETISAIQNPPVAGYVKQANIAHGHQQVNNGPAPEPSRTEEKEIPQNELLEEINGERLDTRATRKAGKADQDMETMESEHRPNLRRRKKKVCT